MVVLRKEVIQKEAIQLKRYGARVIIWGPNNNKYRKHRQLQFNLLPMSLFRACLQASSIYTRAQVQCISVLGRGMANDSIPAKKESSEIVAPEPVREVLVADVISGAPGVSKRGGRTVCWTHDTGQANFDTVPSVSTNLQEIPCRAVQARQDAGDSTLTSCLEGVDGRIPWWDGPVRESSKSL